MKEQKDYGVHWMTEDEAKKDLETLTPAGRRSMLAASEHWLYVRKIAERDGKIPDADWMKKL